jgi:hypothetical protein
MKRKPSARSPRYRVNMQVESPLPLSKNGSGVEFRVYDGDHTIGTIKIGRGSFWWAARNKRSFTPIRWRDFAAVMKECTR